MKKIDRLFIAPVLAAVILGVMAYFGEPRREEVRYERCLKVVDSYVEQEQ